MRIYLHELSESEKELHYSEKDPWIVNTVHSTEESSISPLQKSPYKVDFSLRKLQEVVHLKGKMVLLMGLVCSRCANPFEFKLSGGFQTMFTREKSLSPESEGNVGIAYSEKTDYGSEDLEMVLLEKDYIELEDVLKEQIYLQLPVQPLCKEDCKGICPVCGQDQNTQPCQCHRLQNSIMANALKRFKR